MDDEPSKLFNAYYFAHDCGEPYLRNDIWLNRFDVFAKRICMDIQPVTVLDAGCALGLLVEVLRKRGVEAWGIDISEYAIQNVHPDFRDYCQIGSITDPLPFPHYDLIVSIEVLEHLPKEDADKAIANLCQHSDDILFSSTPNDYQEATHFNVQPSEVWVEHFARYGFFRDVDYDASYITPWAIRFRRQELSLARLARNYERALAPLWHGNIVLRRQLLSDRDRLDENERIIAEIQAKLTLKDAQSSELEYRITELRAQLNATHDRILELAQKNQEQEYQLTAAQEQKYQLAAAQDQHKIAENHILQLQQEKQDLELQLLNIQSQLDSIQQHKLYRIFKAFLDPRT